MKLSLLLIPICGLSFLIAGCGGNKDGLKLELVPVTGTVTLDSKPLAGASVIFTPHGSVQGLPSYGITDANGKYDLKYGNTENGAPIGMHRVTVSKFAQRDGSPFPANMPPEEMSAAGVEHVPPKYSNSEITELFADIPAGGKTFDFALKSKGK